MRYTKLITTLLFTTATIGTYAQEYNLGIHINPVLVSPLLDEYSNTNILKVSPMRVNASAGLNLNIRIHKWCIETGANGILKTVQASYTSRSFSTQTGSSKAGFNATAHSTSLEIPLQVGYLLYHHQDKTTYDLFGFIGAGYETNVTQGYSTSGYAYSTGSGNTPSNTGSLEFVRSKPDANIVTRWVNLIAGIKVNAILRKVGLIDYGVSFHYPLQNAGEHSLTAILAQGGSLQESTVTFSPRLAHTDIKLCYYFLNLDSRMKSKHYRKYE